jgi:hypothetical protein
LKQVISIKDNDSLAARIAAEVEADLMILLTDVPGLYSSPPGTPGSRLIHTYSPVGIAAGGGVVFGEKSRVGLGGMDSKVSDVIGVLSFIHVMLAWHAYRVGRDLIIGRDYTSGPFSRETMRYVKAQLRTEIHARFINLQ